MADYTYVVSTGTIVPDTDVVLEQVISEWRGIFGQDLVVDASTPQGMWIVTEALARSAVLRNNAAVANQMNPYLSGGIFLDALLALTGAQRKAAEYTTVPAQLNGVNGTVIPKASQARDNVTGELFQSDEEITLTGSLVSVDFSAVNPGSIAVGIGALTQIVTPILGWETITNAAIGVPGSLVQSDPAAKSLRRVTLASQGSSLSEAIMSAVNLVPGVKIPIYFRENPTGATAVIDGISLIAHSMFASVYGGTDEDIAAAILSKKSGGCAYNGNTTVVLTDAFSGQLQPVTFFRPTEVPILIRVTVKQDTSIANLDDAVKAAILSYAAGELAEEPGFVVGGNVSSFELGGAVNRVYPGIYVKLVETASNIITPVYSSNEIVITGEQIPTLQESSIQVIIA